MCFLKFVVGELTSPWVVTKSASLLVGLCL